VIGVGVGSLDVYFVFGRNERGVGVMVSELAGFSVVVRGRSLIRHEAKFDEKLLIFGTLDLEKFNLY